MLFCKYILDILSVASYFFQLAAYIISLKIFVEVVVLLSKLYVIAILILHFSIFNCLYSKPSTISG